MSIEDFEIGDVVRLNCSAMRMTVDRIDPDNETGAVVCIWISDDHDLRSPNFHPEQLIVVRARK